MIQPSVRFLLAASLLACTSAAAAAQDTLPPVDQITRVGPEALQQISAPAARQIPASPAPPRTIATTQLTTDGRQGQEPRQLTSAAASKDSPAQVSSGVRSAEGSQALSRPSDGRTSAVERVAGDDRCDPVRRDRSARTKCAAVIENRAADYPRRDAAALSPEQRLLAEQHGNEAIDPLGAARRLATGRSGVDAPELQGIASVVLRAPPPEKQDKPDQEKTPIDAAAAIVAAIMGQGAPGAPPPD